MTWALAAACVPVGVRARRANAHRDGTDPGTGPATRDRGHGTVLDVVVSLGYLALAVLVYGPLWMNLESGYLTDSSQDQNMWEWFFSATAHNVLNGENPLISTLQNHPDGVNMMANTAMLGVGIPFTPVTAVFGPTVTWTVALTLGLAGTAAAWYWVLSRHIVGSRLGAAVGGAFAGFAPPIISHANAHPNFVVLWVFPCIVLGVLKLAQGVRPVLTGAIVGLLLSYQAFLGKEPLLIGATTFAVFAVAYCLCRPRTVPRMLRPVAVGSGVALGVCALVLAFPVWWQFFGPQSYVSLEHGPRGNDLAAFATFATESVAAGPEKATELSINPTEQNAFFGVPLLVFLCVVAGMLWRRALTWALLVTGVVLAWVSTGTSLVVDGTDTGLQGPWTLLAELPLYESVLESRFALGCVPVIAVLLAMATERALSAFPRSLPWRVAARVMFCSALTVALLPIAPTPLPTHQRPPVPAFVTTGAWREFVDPEGAMVVAPLPDPGNVDALHWQAAADGAFPVPEGYFVGPHGTDRAGGYGADRRETSVLLDRVDESGEVPELGLAERAVALRDLSYWRADVVVLAPGARHPEAVKTVVTSLVGTPPRMVAGSWVWDVREFTLR